MARRNLSKAAWAACRRSCLLEALEPRTFLAGDVISYHNDAGSTGQNLTETVLTLANVNTTNFGKRFTRAVDGNVYAQPLFKQNVNITTGANQGVHNVLYVVTQHDSLYAIDANDGTILWQDSFLNVTDPTNLTATAGVTPMHAYSGNSDTAGSTLITPEIGITSTPVIDPTTNIIYLVAKTKEFRNGSTPAAGGADRHYVQRLWAINLSDGSVALGGPALIGDTVKNTTISNPSDDVAALAAYNDYQYFAGPVVNGSGNNGNIGGNNVTDGWIPSTDPNHLGFEPDAEGKIAFNALLHLNRVALTLLNGRIYVGFASHGDRGPYYGWIMSYSASTLALTGAFVVDPTFTGIVATPALYTAQGGIWMSGATFATDGTYLYCTTGNGAFNEADSNFDAAGFPIDHNYADCLIKIGVDPSSSPVAQNGNGWGIKVYDYFCPSNQLKLNLIDADVSCSGVTLLPDGAGIPGHPHLLVFGGKEGRIYLVDRDNLGKFNFNYPENATTAPYPDPRDYDRVLGEYLGNPINTDPNRMNDTATYFNGRFYLHLSARQAWSFNVSTFASGTVPPGSTVTPSPFQTTSATFGNPGGTQSASANGSTNGIIWVLSDANSTSDKLTAYNASSYISTIYDSNTNSARDSLTAAGGGTRGVKFVPPTVINGMVYCATGGINSSDGTDGLGSIVGYGLLDLAMNPPFTLTAPSLVSATANTPTRVHLSWTRNSTNETMTRIERSPTGGAGTFVPIAYVTNGVNSYDDDAVTSGQSYFYRLAAVNGPSIGSFSSTASASTAVTGLVPPKGQFLYQSGAQRLTFKFNSDVSATIGPEDLRLDNLTTAAMIDSSNTTIVRAWDSGTSTATFTFPALPNGGALPNGNYRATLLASGISSPQYGSMPVNYQFDFYFVNGDANHNGTVNIDDLNAVASHWKQPASDYGSGDFDHSGFVDETDLGILALNWQYTLSGPLPASAPVPPPTRPPMRTAVPARAPRRTIELIDETLTASGAASA